MGDRTSRSDCLNVSLCAKDIKIQCLAGRKKLKVKNINSKKKKKRLNLLENVSCLMY